MLYVDTSAFLDRLMIQKDFERTTAALVDAERRGERIVASRLLRLEARRVQVRLGLDWTSIERQVQELQLLPLSESVWRAAFDIEVHVKTLDALHLATCQLIDARLLTSDDQLRRAATAIGVAVVD